MSIRRRAARELLLVSERFLQRHGKAVVSASRTIAARRVKLLAHTGVQSVIDIGANEGQWGAEVRHAGWSGPIWSFEPVASAFAALEATAAADPSWHVRRVAVGDERGQMTMTVAQDSMFSSLVPMSDVGLRSNRSGVAPATVEEVGVETLDDLACDIPGVLAVKMDVQGYESKVMDGGPETIARARYLEAELSLVPCYDGEPLYREMLDRICGMGFRFALVEPVWPDKVTGESLQFNGIFIRDVPGRGPGD